MFIKSSFYGTTSKFYSAAAAESSTHVTFMNFVNDIDDILVIDSS